MTPRRLFPLLLACALLAGCDDSSSGGGSSQPAAGTATTGAPGTVTPGGPAPKQGSRQPSSPAGGVEAPSGSPDPAQGTAPPSRAECVRKKRELSRGGGLSPEGRLELQGAGCGYLTK